MRLIDADHLISLVNDATILGDGFKQAFTAIVNGEPTIEPERKRGKWIPENRTMDAFWVCSSCGFPSEAHAANILYKFCPNCGAKMEEGEQE